MSNEAKNSPLLSSLWQKFKKFFIVEDGEEASTTVPAKIAYRVRFFERCLKQDTLTEKIRKRLEHQWAQNSSIEPRN